MDEKQKIDSEGKGTQNGKCILFSAFCSPRRLGVKGSRLDRSGSNKVGTITHLMWAEKWVAKWSMLVVDF